jgi:Protein of unknown function (DUF1236)
VLALVAGAGMAAAQNSPQDQSAPKTKQPNAAQQMNTGPKGGQMGENDRNPSRNAQNQNAGPKANMNGQHTAQKNYSNKAAKSTANKTYAAQMQERNKGAMARHEAAQRRESVRTRTAQHNDMQGLQGNATEFKGLQGNASGTNIRLNDEQRTQIRTTVLNAPGAPRVDNANFNVAVGTVIPRTGVRIVPVPETLVRIDPAWRGYRYFVWTDNIVIVDPRTMKIVAVLYV